MKKKPADKSADKSAEKRRRLIDRELDRAIAEIISHRARIDATIDELETATKRLHHTAREFEELAQEVRQRGVLDTEVEKAIAKLKVTFRDGPVQINESLIKLAQDILQEQIRSVLQDQMHKLTKELALIVREEVQAEVSAAVRDALEGK
jgi:hypothetical protein